MDSIKYIKSERVDQIECKPKKIYREELIDWIEDLPIPGGKKFVPDSLVMASQYLIDAKIFQIR